MVRRDVAFILNINKPYDRKVVEGIARYVRTKANWRVYVEDEPMARIPDLRRWKGHGVIADLDDQQAVDAVKTMKVPVV
ncbi:MAG: LacI family transcriptional regulator, partial [Planctomycetaceae bacterium]